MPSEEILLVEAKDREAWRGWLEKNHAGAKGAWLVMQKKGSPHPGVTYEEAVEEALCFAWIDSKTNRIDDHRYKLMMTPRRAFERSSGRSRASTPTSASQVPSRLARATEARPAGAILPSRISFATRCLLLAA